MPVSANPASAARMGSMEWKSFLQTHVVYMNYDTKKQ